MSASTNGNTTNGGGGGGSSAASASVTVETETASLAGSDEPVLSMTDVLRSQMEVERRAVEIASKAPEFEKCSYGDGYSDQPVYACATCHPKDSGVQAGFCYGCSMTWYDGRCLQPTLSMADAGLRVAVYRVCSHVEHDVYELFIKRHFRCDCGNSLSGGRYKCELQAVKDATNPQNKYNHNFDGLYCHCNKPHDPNAGVMYQCLLCSDWFHDTCIGGQLPLDRTSEFVCRTCFGSANYSVLQPYIAKHAVSTNSVSGSGSGGGGSGSGGGEGTPTKRLKTAHPTAEPAQEVDTKSAAAPPVRTASANASTLSSGCRRPSAPPTPFVVRDLFISSDWRDALCTCEACNALYRTEGVEFLFSVAADSEGKFDSILHGGDSDGEGDSEDDTSPSQTGGGDEKSNGTGTGTGTGGGSGGRSVDPALAAAKAAVRDPLSAQSVIELMAAQLIGRLPRSATAATTEKMQGFMDRIKSGLRDLQNGNPSLIVTKDAIQRIIADAKEGTHKRKHTDDAGLSSS